MTVREWLAHVFLGHVCPICLERQRGPRTLDAHLHVEHAGDRA